MGANKRRRNALIGAAIGAAVAALPAIFLGRYFHNEAGNGGAVAGATIAIGVGAGALARGRTLLYRRP